MARMFGELPAVLASYRAEPCAHVVAQPGAWRDAAEVVPNGGEEVVKVAVPGLSLLFW